ncbi:Heterogeneous nuclear ribonucleoprotein Q isoform X4 [Aix galericulata]|nr:Heterogeneous nuclear ribonucleoprotein Q isoform X4 [Aix galericulata]
MATEHVNGNGTEEPMDTSAAVTHSEHFQTLLDAGLPQKVAEKLDEIYVAGLVAHSDLDERAIEALKEFNEEGALAVLQQFKDSDLSHVQNKSAFLCGVMKTYRQREKQGTKVADSSKGPDEAKIKALLERTGYTLDVTTGQRKYGGPPPESVYSGQQPSVGTEIFVGKIPRDLFEDELVPLFEKAGPIWDLRLMMDPLTGLNRGYAFVTFCTKEAAQEAVKLYNNHEIRSGKHIGVCISVANNRLFVGSIPKSKTKEQIVEEFSKVTEGLTDVILYHQPDDKKKNRGFCFLEYEDHKTAAQARRRLMSGKVKVWGNVVTVEWADPIEDPDPEVMAKVKVLFVRNLANTVTEEILEKAFSQFGKLERVKKLKDYAFIHFDERDGAVKAMEEMNGKDLEGENIEIVFAKPPDQKRKERKAQRQAAKNQMYDDYYYYGPPHMPPPTRGRGRGGRGGYGYPPDYYGYEDYYDYYGYDYHNYRGGYEDPYYGYEDFQVGARGRGGRGARGAAPSRGRGAAPPRGRAGYAQRGGPGSARGVRGARGGAQQQRGRGVRGARGGRGGNVGGKRKADGYNQPDSKRRQTNNQNWGSQPIAQQPLQGGDHSGNYGYKSENQEFYQDSFGQHSDKSMGNYCKNAKIDRKVFVFNGMQAMSLIQAQHPEGEKWLVIFQDLVLQVDQVSSIFEDSVGNRNIPDCRRLFRENHCAGGKSAPGAALQTTGEELQETVLHCSGRETVSPVGRCHKQDVHLAEELLTRHSCSVYASSACSGKTCIAFESSGSHHSYERHSKLHCGQHFGSLL